MLRKQAWLGMVIAFCAGCGWFVFWKARDVPMIPAAQAVLSPEAPPVKGPRSGPPIKASPLGPAALADLEEVWGNLGELEDAARAKTLLEILAARLRITPPDEAARIIGEFLRSNRNARTQLPFCIGNGGCLTTAPTFRVWLMDQLARVDGKAAAAHAEVVLAKRESAEEWAVALRNYARKKNTAADLAFLRKRMRELVREPRWQAEQAQAWLEAFDVAVHIRATELAPDFAAMVTRTAPEDKAVAHAACLTLDRLTQAEPVTMLSRFLAEPGLLRGRELTRATFFARADVRDPRQRRIVEQYLLDPGRSPEELAKFSAVYPNANLMISKNLLTATPAPSREEWQARDRGALDVASSWLADARFARIKPQVEMIHARLAGFVREAER